RSACALLRAPASRRLKSSPTWRWTLSAARWARRMSRSLSGFVGVQNAAYPINTVYLWTSGPEEAVLQVQLNPKAGIRVAELEERLRQKLSQELPRVRYSFEPSD